MASDSFPVWFNKDQKEIFEILKKDGLTSKSFQDFVKDAFHDKADDIRARRGLDIQTIEELAQQQISKKTREAIKS